MDWQLHESIIEVGIGINIGCMANFNETCFVQNKEGFFSYLIGRFANQPCSSILMSKHIFVMDFYK